MTSAPVALAAAARKGVGTAKFSEPGVREWLRAFGAGSNSLDLLGVDGSRRSVGIADASLLIIQGTRESLVELLRLPELAKLSTLASPMWRD